MALVLIFSALSPIDVWAATSPDLNTAESFAVLAGSGISDTSPSVITGDVGLSPDPGTDITGLTSGEVSGTIYAVDAAGPDGASGNNPALVNGAKTDLTAAYTAASQVTTGVISADLGGQTLNAGVYEDNDAPDSLSIAAGQTLTLDGQGNANAVFIFKSGSTLVTGAGSTVSLINGASACNVWWQVASSATLGTATNFAGNILALTSITDDGGSTIDGRLLARNGAVTLNDTTVTVPTCATAASGGSSVYTGTISVVKIVVNDNGGTQEVEDFPLFINDTRVLSGATTTFPANPNQYFVTEASNANYTQEFSGDCDEFGFMNLRGAQHLLCVLTNDDIGTPVVVPPVPPIIEVVKVPSPLAFPDGPGTVTYTYSLHNIGAVPVTDVTMIDNTCQPAFASGDSNGDTYLDLDETWIYSCTNTLSSTHTNTVVASGWANGLNAVDVATATVVVGESIVPPLIHVTKIPNPLTLLAGGGLVTYTETITNPGEVPLSNVTIADNKCSPVTYVSGDTNNDELLDINESWVHTCSSNITVNTTNTVTVTGEANGLEATDFAVVTVLVAAALPTLPNTGIAAEDSAMVWPLLAASFGAVSLLGYLLLKKLTA